MPVSGPAAAPDPVTHLTRRAGSWLGDALEAWYRDDHDKVAALAPLAVELLGKAVLWRRHPALLVPLQQDAEHSLITLVTNPDLTASKLRTVGLGTMLTRLDRLLSGLPVDPSRRKRLVDVRNGAVHVGASATARHVLLDSLTLCRVFVEHLGVDFGRFCGRHHEAVLQLLDEEQTEIAGRVAAKRTRSRQRFNDMHRWVGAEQVPATVQRLEERGWYDLNPAETGGSNLCAHRCPACSQRGCLTGTIDVDVVDENNGYYRTASTFVPQGFTCNVCGLRLSGLEELLEAGLPHEPFRPEGGDLGEDFDPFDFI